MATLVPQLVKLDPTFTLLPPIFHYVHRRQQVKGGGRMVQRVRQVRQLGAGVHK